jgi:hypothetical protein
MELLLFLFGVLTTIAIVGIINSYKKRKDAKRTISRQSTVFLEIKKLMPDLMTVFLNMETQSQTYESTKAFNYVEVSGKIYWIDKTYIYYTEIRPDGRFDPTKKKLVSLKNLSKEQISKTLFIYNSLKNG